MSDSFESVFREVREYCPHAPLPLCQRWVRDRYRLVIRTKLWSWALAESQFVFPTAYSAGTVAVAEAGAVVTGTGTSWTSAMAGRQIKIDNHMFTISSVDAVEQTLVVDRVWPLADASGRSYSIHLAYVGVPADFRAFRTVIDPVEGTRVITHVSGKELDRLDPQRASTGCPTLLASLSYASGRPRYEAWPHAVTQKVLRFLYWKIPPDFSETQDLPHNLPGDVIKFGALADLCMWPGTAEKPNPMFGPKNASIFEARFREGLSDLWREDEEIYLSEFWYDLEDEIPMPFSAEYWQRHAL